MPGLVLSTIGGIVLIVFREEITLLAKDLWGELRSWIRPSISIKIRGNEKLSYALNQILMGLSSVRRHIATDGTDKPNFKPDKGTYTIPYKGQSLCIKATDDDMEVFRYTFAPDGYLLLQEF